MLIQCENCRTIFNLDETLLKEDGSKVRCSRCGHLFMAYPPVHKEEDVSEQILDFPMEDRNDVADELALMSDDAAPSRDLKTDQPVDSDFENVYVDTLSETNPYLEDREIDALEKTEVWDRETMSEGKGDAKSDHSMDFRPMDTLDEGRDIPKKEAKTVTRSSSRMKPSKRGLIAALLAILMALLIGAGALTYWKPDLIRPYVSFFQAAEKQKPVDAGVRLLRFESVSGSFVDTGKGGQLFVIRGMVHNHYPAPRSHILIKGSILDNKGTVVESRVAYAGNTLTEDELKSLTIEEVLKTMKNRDGMARKNLNLPSDATIPFMVVFGNLPDNLSEFAVEAVSSSPGA